MKESDVALVRLLQMDNKMITERLSAIEKHLGMDNHGNFK